MANKIKFHKMHGAGNDYIYVNTLVHPIPDPETYAIKWSKPHTGIGSDGLVLIGSSGIADFSMRIFNADGSEAMMCGNATRCIGKYLYEQKLTVKKQITLETLSGIKEIHIHETLNKVKEVSVNMGEPVIGESITEIEVDKKVIQGTIVSMGNPHYVIFTENVESIELTNLGPQIENHPLFPDRTNVEFVQVLSGDKVRMRVWERGSGITQACGTGACATIVAGVCTQKINRKAIVQMDGGSLTIDWDKQTNNIWMTGDAVMLYEGIIEL